MNLSGHGLKVVTNVLVFDIILTTISIVTDLEFGAKVPFHATYSNDTLVFNAFRGLFLVLDGLHDPIR